MSDQKPTVVLVHGAFAESSSWSAVIMRLLDGGYPAIAVAIPLRGVASDTEYLVSILDGINGDTVLVGHSYGGMIISGAAAGRVRAGDLVAVVLGPALEGLALAGLTAAAAAMTAARQTRGVSVGSAAF